MSILDYLFSQGYSAEEINTIMDEIEYYGEQYYNADTIPEDAEY
jgi:hypothetical protein